MVERTMAGSDTNRRGKKRWLAEWGFPQVGEVETRAERKQRSSAAKGREELERESYRGKGWSNCLQMCKECRFHRGVQFWKRKQGQQRSGQEVDF